MNVKNQQFLSELEELQKDNGLTNKNRKAWRSSNYQIQSQQKSSLTTPRSSPTRDLPCREF